MRLARCRRRPCPVLVHAASSKQAVNEPGKQAIDIQLEIPLAIDEARQVARLAGSSSKQDYYAIC